MSSRDGQVFGDEIFAPSPMHLWERAPTSEEPEDSPGCPAPYYTPCKEHGERQENPRDVTNPLAPTGPQTPVVGTAETNAPTPAVEAFRRENAFDATSWYESSKSQRADMPAQMTAPVPIQLGDATETRYLKVWSLPKLHSSPPQEDAPEQMPWPDQQTLLQRGLGGEDEIYSRDDRAEELQKTQRGNSPRVVEGATNIDTINNQKRTAWAVRGIGEGDEKQRDVGSRDLVP